MGRTDSEKCRLCSKLSTQEAQDRHVTGAIAAGRISAVITVVPTIVIAACAIITANRNEEENREPLK